MKILIFFSWKQILDEINEALLIKKEVKSSILGLLSYLWLGKNNSLNFDCLKLLPKILKVYKKIIFSFYMKGIKWV